MLPTCFHTAALAAVAAPLLFVGACLAADAAPGAAPGAAPAPAMSRESRTFHLALHGAADVVFPLFGPVRESEWSPGWAPRFVYPATPAQGPDGAVFTTEGADGAAPSLWVMNDYDPAARRVRYTILHPGVSVGELAIVVSPAGDAACTADVTYRFTALSADGNASIARWIEHFPHMAPHLEGAINARLDGHP
jgi:hypothetical protein